MNAPRESSSGVLCPKCGTRFPFEKYATLIELGVDGVRDQCRVCGTISQIMFGAGPDRERGATAVPEG